MKFAGLFVLFLIISGSALGASQERILCTDFKENFVIDLAARRVYQEMPARDQYHPAYRQKFDIKEFELGKIPFSAEIVIGYQFNVEYEQRKLVLSGKKTPTSRMKLGYFDRRFGKWLEEPSYVLPCFFFHE